MKHVSMSQSALFFICAVKIEKKWQQNGTERVEQEERENILMRRCRSNEQKKNNNEFIDLIHQANDVAAKRERDIGATQQLRLQFRKIKWGNERETEKKRSIDKVSAAKRSEDRNERRKETKVRRKKNISASAYNFRAFFYYKRIKENKRHNKKKATNPFSQGIACHCTHNLHNSFVCARSHEQSIWMFTITLHKNAKTESERARKRGDSFSSALCVLKQRPSNRCSLLVFNDR